MPTGEAPRYSDVLTFSNDLSHDPPELDGFIDVEKRRLGRNTSITPTNEIAVAHLLMRTGVGFIEGIKADALKSGKSKNFYPGGIRFEKASDGFVQASDNEKKMIMTNYAAIVYGLAVQMVEQMVTSKTGIFPAKEFASRYNLLIHKTGFPPLQLEHFIDPNAKHFHIGYTDDGVGEILPSEDMETLVRAYEKGGILYLFDNNDIQPLLPKSLLWFFKKQGLLPYFPIIHKEVRKLVKILDTGRRNVSKKIADQLILDDFPWNENFTKMQQEAQANEPKDQWDEVLWSILHPEDK